MQVGHGVTRPGRCGYVLAIWPLTCGDATARDTTLISWCEVLARKRSESYGSPYM